ncbi:hypothetical protein H0H81_008948 [Sphagnurus paluster]|uniref:Carboxylesterase type B domain-containing protein n=1 Tax=Sphagnurus paluster TaxID=117069 RepID=A0A9P7FV45_9AGAR|nr:hypothetical protein H0H81_008948 [Sphagnurus paluster]
MLYSSLVFLALCARPAVAVAVAALPTVKLDSATITGTNGIFSSKFLGIPFAKPPVGDLRFRLPQPIPAYTTNFAASSFGLSCPQQAISLPIVSGLAAEAANLIVNSIFGTILPDSEDCAYRFHEVGKCLECLYRSYVECGKAGECYTDIQASGRSGAPRQAIQCPAYRGTGFGFLAGKEVKAAGIGNLGLQDRNWGQSAGAISTSLHMVANNGNAEGLFRAAFMQSGSPIPVGDITNGQKYYDAIVSQTGCSGSADTLSCLRKVSYATLKAAINKTEAQLKSYVQNTFLPGVTAAEVDKLATLYPDSVTEGSPFDTGYLNVLSPQFKRIASFQGDGVFQAPRRFFLQERSGKQNTWAFLSKRLKFTPVLGSFHASDILNVYGGGGMADYLIRFATNLNPNSNFGLQWPQYTTSSPKLLTFMDGYETITDDTYRKDAMAYLINVTFDHPL